MVSSGVNVDLEELLQVLARLRAEAVDDPEYQRWRAEFPADWPM